MDETLAWELIAFAIAGEAFNVGSDYRRDRARAGCALIAGIAGDLRDIKRGLFS